MRWRVRVRRTEEILFEVEAPSAEAAEEAYLREGDEVSAESVDLEVLETEEVAP